ncbi:MAG: hypothetical protein ACREQR_10360 [Candidatus Binataceae bacterium]
MLRQLSSLFLAFVLVSAFRIETAFAQVQVAEIETAFDCEPVRLYRGDSLTVTFHSPHDQTDLAMSNPDGQTMIISFKRGPEDKVAPVIPHDKFGQMKRVTLDTANAQGSVIKERAHVKTPAVLGPPELIFKKTGSYDVIVGLDLRAATGEIGVCDLNYFDYAKPTAKRAAQEPKPR